MAIVRRYYNFSGHVQGVGFRYSAQYTAQLLGLTGWVTNEWDDTVTMEVQGEDTKINEMIRKISARRFIRIDDMKVKELPLEKESGFHVR